MAAISGATSRRVASYKTYEWQYYLSGFEWVLQYRATDNEEWEVACDSSGIDAYSAATPAGYTQNGYENRIPWNAITGVHIDKFRKVGTWTAA